MLPLKKLFHFSGGTNNNSSRLPYNSEIPRGKGTLTAAAAQAPHDTAYNEHSLRLDKETSAASAGSSSQQPAAVAASEPKLLTPGSPMESLRRRHYRPPVANAQSSESQQKSSATPLVAVPIIETPIGMKRASYIADYSTTADAYPDPGMYYDHDSHF